MGGAAHDINNRNGCLRGGVDLLQHIFPDVLRALDELYALQGDFTLGGLPYDVVRTELPDALREMRTASERIARVVGDLQEYCRPVEEERAESVDLNEAIATAVRLTSGALRSRTHHIQVVYGDALPPIQANRRKLIRAWVDVLRTAAPVLNDRGARLRLTTLFHSQNVCAWIDLEQEQTSSPDTPLGDCIQPILETSRLAALFAEQGFTTETNCLTKRCIRVEVSFVPTQMRD